MKQSSFSLALLSCLFFYSAACSGQIITTFAGSTVTTYGGDGGPGVSAILARPAAVAVDGAGNVYVGDGDNSRVRVINAAGVITTIAGQGYWGFSGDGGPASAASITVPAGLAVDAAGNIYIADQYNDRIRKIDASGIITTLAGSNTSGYGGDGGPATAAFLSAPSSIAVDGAGNIYFTDNSSYVRKIGTNDTITTIAGFAGVGFGGDGGPATLAALWNPRGITVDTSGNVYVADQFNARIRMINTAGIISTIAGTGVFGFSGDGGSAAAAMLGQPTGLCMDAAGKIYIADLGDDRIRVINTSGIISTIGGAGGPGYAGDGGAATAALLHNPGAVARDVAGNTYIADVLNNRVRKINAAGVMTTIAGAGILDFGNGGPATAAQFSQPDDVAFDGKGNVYISDDYYNVIRKVNAAGVISTFAGNGSSGYSGDGGAAINAALLSPEGMVFDTAGNLYICDAENGLIRKVDTSGIITTVAGKYGLPSSTGDGGPATAAGVTTPESIGIDDTGNLFISDGNVRIRKINTAGIISTIAGSGALAFSGDGGPATAAELYDPFVAVGNNGDIYIADMINQRIRVINAAGIINTISGNGTAGYAGDGGPAAGAEYDNPVSICMDHAGNVLIGDESNSRVREIDTAGNVHTIAGSSTPGYSGDGGPATAASLYAPGSAKVDNNGDIYIVDAGNAVIRKVSSGSTAAVRNLTTNHEVNIFPNPATAMLTIQSTNAPITDISITNVLGQEVSRQAIVGSLQVGVDVSELAAGVYFVKVN